MDGSYWSRKFKKHMDRKRSSRMTGIPQLDVPDIFVEDDDNYGEGKGSSHTRQSAPARNGPATHLSVDGGVGQRRTVSGATDASLHDNAYQHPLSYPRTSQPTTPLAAAPTGFSFELYEPDVREGGDVSEEMDRRGSVAASPVDAQGILDDSIWMDSIRRSTTTRRSGGGSYRY